MSMMKAVQVPAAGKPMELVQIPVPKPKADQVLIRVQACGVCHGEAKIIEGWANSYPRIPGHEVVGTIEEAGESASKWKIGQRVGIGWDGGHCCGHHHTTALTMDGGYAEFMVANEDALVLIPDDMSSAEAAPILCAGETVFSALRNSSARAGDTVAISGIGGLGHLAIQYGKKMGFRVVAISNGHDKERLARELGAHDYIDASIEDVGQKLKDLGGANVIVATAPNGKTINGLIPGLGKDAELIIAAVSDEACGRSCLAWPSQAPENADPGRKSHAAVESFERGCDRGFNADEHLGGGVSDRAAGDPARRATDQRDELDSGAHRWIAWRSDQGAGP